MAVFVLDKQNKPLMPCTEKRARLLLERGRAVVVRLAPFTIRLKDRRCGATQPVRIKLDPGSKTTGIALVREAETIDPETGEITRTDHVLWLGELTHRGHSISEALTARSAMRGRRRTANLRYRQPRFNNRTKPGGWLAPSLRHRVETTINWVERLRRIAPITAISQELVRFDLQAMQNPEISGVEYQQGELAGYEVREYLLEKWHRTCAYCGAQNVPLQIEHIQPTSKGKKTGTHIGRVAVRASGSFNLQTATGVMQGISHRYCRVLQRADGDGYTFNPTPTEDARRAV